MESSCWMKCQYRHSQWFAFAVQIPKFSRKLKCDFAAVKKTSNQVSSRKSNKWVWAIKSKSNKDGHGRATITPAAITGTGREDKSLLLNHSRKSKSKIITVTAAAASIGLLVMLMCQDDKAWALGPEGPLVEEFWENVRRYALYALTVSTGVLYAVLQPIVELLKNPISAFLVILIFAATFFIFSQLLSAMFGVSDFAYQYAY